MSIDNSTLIVCNSGHVFDTKGVNQPPEIRGQIGYCPYPVGDGKECGERVWWKNPLPFPVAK